jgi:predicted RNA-binding protein YlxR (DUF448 family)
MKTDVKTKHVPMRMCAVTREKLPKTELIRIALLDGKLVIDTKGKVRSRGINIKPELTVFDEAVKKNVFKRTFHINITPEAIEKLRADFEDSVEKKLGIKRVVRISQTDFESLKQ